MSANVSPIKRVFSRKAIVTTWAKLLFTEFSAVKRSSADELERYLLGFASIRDVYEYFVHKIQLIADPDEKRFYV